MLWAWFSVHSVDCPELSIHSLTNQSTDSISLGIRSKKPNERMLHRQRYKMRHQYYHSHHCSAFNDIDDGTNIFKLTMRLLVLFTLLQVVRLLDVIWDGPAGVVGTIASMTDARAFRAEELGNLRLDHVRQINPTPYKVSGAKFDTIDFAESTQHLIN